ncbi:hypothetical protein H2203_008757 [Taxawa tesnikishii (nom. ined.)]|nr:hypothetical protein H2203_008757 [Dothideales sp. JES 119]
MLQEKHPMAEWVFIDIQRELKKNYATRIIEKENASLDATPTGTKGGNNVARDGEVVDINQPLPQHKAQSKAQPAPKPTMLPKTQPKQSAFNNPVFDPNFMDLPPTRSSAARTDICAADGGMEPFFGDQFFPLPQQTAPKPAPVPKVMNVPPNHTQVPTGPNVTAKVQQPQQQFFPQPPPNAIPVRPKPAQKQPAQPVNSFGQDFDGIFFGDPNEIVGIIEDTQPNKGKKKVQQTMGTQGNAGNYGPPPIGVNAPNVSMRQPTEQPKRKTSVKVPTQNNKPNTDEARRRQAQEKVNKWQSTDDGSETDEASDWDSDGASKFTQDTGDTSWHNEDSPRTSKVEFGTPSRSRRNSTARADDRDRERRYYREHRRPRPHQNSGSSSRDGRDHRYNDERVTVIPGNSQRHGRDDPYNRPRAERRNSAMTAYIHDRPPLHRNANTYDTSYESTPRYTPRAPPLVEDYRDPYIDRQRQQERETIDHIRQRERHAAEEVMQERLERAQRAAYETGRQDAFEDNRRRAYDREPQEEYGRWRMEDDRRSGEFFDTRRERQRYGRPEPRFHY